MGISPLLLGGGEGWPRAEILGEMAERAQDRIGREAAERAERAEFHRVAEVFDQREIRRAVLAAHHAVDHLDAAAHGDHRHAVRAHDRRQRSRRRASEADPQTLRLRRWRYCSWPRKPRRKA